MDNNDNHGVGAREGANIYGEDSGSGACDNNQDVTAADNDVESYDEEDNDHSYTNNDNCNSDYV